MPFERILEVITYSFYCLNVLLAQVIELLLVINGNIILRVALYLLN